MVLLNRSSLPSNIKLASRILLPALKEPNVKPDKNNAKPSDLLERAGFVHKSSAGIYNYLPLGELVLSKLTQCIDESMQSIDGTMKVKLSHLQPRSLWDRTQRATTMHDEMFHVDEMVLAPTHEEEITNIVSSLVSSYRQLPLRLYQIGEKYRNEYRPRGGLLRCREFIMKDLYTFDKTLDEATETYTQVSSAYRGLFSRLGLKVYQAEAWTGDIGGDFSHEFQLESENGQDEIFLCNNCEHSWNKELSLEHTCPKCKSDTRIGRVKCLEIGHTFLLGNKYSKALKAKFKDRNGDEHFIEMGCYGIGVSRLMAAVAETFNDSCGIVWPEIIAPYNSYIISMNENYSVEHYLSYEGFSGKTAIFDDREGISLTRKFKDALLIGVPNIFVLGGKKSPSGVEWYKRVLGGYNLVNN